ncbi:MAG: hypothetical protein QOI58_3733 [Thermoanaerobaculia bacterium]|jgi:hypothetical protein|nr:hypothetical protein [Thermoanaerobaculia bacterium]
MTNRETGSRGDAGDAEKRDSAISAAPRAIGFPWIHSRNALRSDLHLRYLRMRVYPRERLNKFFFIVKTFFFSVHTF